LVSPGAPGDVPQRGCWADRLAIGVQKKKGESWALGYRRSKKKKNRGVTIPLLRTGEKHALAVGSFGSGDRDAGTEILKKKVESSKRGKRLG